MFQLVNREARVKKGGGGGKEKREKESRINLTISPRAFVKLYDAFTVGNMMLLWGASCFATSCKLNAVQ